MYALAAELRVPVLVHFQEVPHYDGEGVWETGFKRFEAMLRKYPNTRFIGHADAFWANGTPAITRRRRIRPDLSRAAG